MTGNFDKSDSSYWDGYYEKMKERDPRHLQSPILRPGHFPALWEKVTKAVKTGGRFAGQFFGVNDTWAYRKDMIFHTGDQVRALFADFEIEPFTNRMRMAKQPLVQNTGMYLRLLRGRYRTTNN
jgi:hypothetical protein